MHKCSIHTTVNTAPEHGCRLDAGRVHVFTRTVNTVRFHGPVVCRVISKCPSNGKNSEYDVTANRKQIVVYD